MLFILPLQESFVQINVFNIASLINSIHDISPPQVKEVRYLLLILASLTVTFLLLSIFFWLFPTERSDFYRSFYFIFLDMMFSSVHAEVFRSSNTLSIQPTNDNISISLNHFLSFIEKSILYRRTESWKELFLFDVKSIHWVLQTHQRRRHLPDDKTVLYDFKEQLPEKL